MLLADPGLVNLTGSSVSTRPPFQGSPLVSWHILVVSRALVEMCGVVLGDSLDVDGETS